MSDMVLLFIASSISLTSSRNNPDVITFGLVFNQLLVLFLPTQNGIILGEVS